MSRIAIVTSYPYHYECLGAILWWVRRNKLKCDIFYPIDHEDGKAWMMFYKRCHLIPSFKKQFNFSEWENMRGRFSFNIFLSEYDIHISPPVFQRENHKHSVALRHYAKTKSKVKIVNIRKKNPKEPTISTNFPIPLFLKIPPSEKVSIVIVGITSKYIVQEDPYVIGPVNLRPLLKIKFKRVRLRFISRDPHPQVKKLFPSTEVLKNVRVDEMMRVIRSSHAVVIPKFREFVDRRLSGVIPLAISLNVPIIAPRKMILSLGYKSGNGWYPIESAGFSLSKASEWRRKRNKHPLTKGFLNLLTKNFKKLKSK